MCGHGPRPKKVAENKKAPSRKKEQQAADQDAKKAKKEKTVSRCGCQVEAKDDVQFETPAVAARWKKRQFA